MLSNLGDRPRPHVTVVLAMTADGKISDYRRSRFRLGSQADKAHLASRVAQVDGILFGAETLRVDGTALKVSNPEHLQEREKLGKPLQPVQIVCSNSGNFALDLPFFSQPVPRWLLTGNKTLKSWEVEFPAAFERILVSGFENLSDQEEHGDTNKEVTPTGINWQRALETLEALGIHQLAVLGGGTLVGSLLRENLIDELWLTICPYLVGGEKAPTVIAGPGLALEQAQKLELKEVKTVGDELFLHYLCL